MPRARRQPQPGRRTDARRNHVPLVRTRPHAAVRNGPAHCSRKREGATQFPTIGLLERNANNFKGTRNTKAQLSWSARDYGNDPHPDESTVEIATISVSAYGIPLGCL